MILWTSEEKEFWSDSQKKSLIETRWILIGWLVWSFWAIYLMNS